MVIAASAAFTPGPNNALLASFGATVGIRKYWGHIAGIGIGFPFMIIMVGLFLGEIFQQSAVLRTGLKSVGVAILLWMAWKTATAGRAGEENARRPFTFWQSAAFQWVNPKSWSFAIGVTSQFVDPDNILVTALYCGAAFAIVGFSSATTWALAGQGMQRFLTNERRRRVFNGTMGALIALSAALLFVG